MPETQPPSESTSDPIQGNIIKTEEKSIPPEQISILTPNNTNIKAFLGSREVALRLVNIFGKRLAFIEATERTQVIVVLSPSRDESVQSVTKWSFKWLSRIGAAIIWLLYASYIFRRPGLLGEILDRTWAPGKSTWEGAILLLVLAGLLVAVSRIETKRAFLASAYIVFFPFTALFILLSNLVGTASLARALISTIGSLSLRGANWLLLLVACIVVDRSSSNFITGLCTLFLALSGLYIVSANFQWVTNPLSSTVNLADWVSKLATGALQKTDAELATLIANYNTAKSRSIKDTARAEILKKTASIIQNASSAKRVSGFTSHVSGKVVLFYIFAIRFLLSMLGVIIVFGGIYRGIGRLFPDAFGGHGMTSLWFSFYYSVVTFFTVGDGSVVPAGTIAQAAVALQVLFGVVTLTVLALSFSTLSLDVAEENGKHVSRRAMEYIAASLSILDRRLGRKNEEPEDFGNLIKEHLDRYLRRSARRSSKDTEPSTPSE